MRRRAKKELKDAQPKYRLIMMDSVAGKEIFAIMRELVNQHHEELRNATIAPAWKKHLREFAEAALRVDKQFQLPMDPPPAKKTSKTEAAQVH